MTMTTTTTRPTLLAIIPAKQNSRRLPHKNLRKLGGKPLITHTIECALQCQPIDRLIVSTDSQEIKAIAEASGAEVPFLRPAELASDTATTYAVVSHAVQFLKETEKKAYDFVIVLQPTSPLRTPADIREAFQLLLASQADSVVSVDASPLHASFLYGAENGYLKPLADYGEDFPKTDFYKLNGAIYISRTATLAQKGRLLGDKIVAYPMPASRSIDIDTPEDFSLAAFYFEKGRP